MRTTWNEEELKLALNIAAALDRLEAADG